MKNGADFTGKVMHI